MLSNISYYFVSRQKLNASISQIEAECNQIFDSKKYEIAKIVKNVSDSIKYNPGEKIDFIKFKFDKDKVLTTKIPEDIAFYFLCRFQLLKDVKIIKQEVEKLFNNKILTINEFEDLVKLFFEKNEEEFEQLKQKCDGLESSILDKNIKLELLSEKCNEFENQINQTKTTKQDLINKLLESQRQKREAFKNYDYAIKKLHEFETNLLKEREVNADHLNEKNNKIKQLESDLKELQEYIKVCDDINNELQIKHDDIKLKNDQLKLEIKRNENNSETNFFNLVVNRRSEIILQQKIDLETENNLLKEQNNEYLQKNKDLNTKIQACKDEILQHSNIIDNLKVEKLLVTENFENFKKLTSAKQNESEEKICELEANIADKVNEHQLQLDQLNKKIKTEFDDFENLKNNLNIKLNQIEQLNELIKQEKSILAEENKKLNDDFGNYKQSTDTKQNKTERRINELEQEKSTLLACLKEKENQHDELLLSSNLLTENNNILNEKIKKLEVELKEADKNMKIKDVTINFQLNKINQLNSEKVAFEKEIKDKSLIIESFETFKKMSSSRLNACIQDIEVIEKEKSAIENELMKTIELAEDKIKNLTNEIKDRNLGFNQILKLAQSNLKNEEEQSVTTTEISLLSRSCFKRKSSIETMNETNESKVCVFFFLLYK
jgi:chromosome segregation ATPase